MFRDVHGSGRAAIVVDDLASASPWRPRGVEVRGRAQAIDGEELSPPHRGMDSVVELPEQSILPYFNGRT